MVESTLVSGFTDADHVVFIGMLVLAAFVGIYYAIKDRNKRDIDTYNYGGRNVSPVPLGLSKAVTYISAITLIGFPTESYLYGLVAIWFAFGCIIPNIVACLYYIPLIHKLRLYTMFEYLEYRFDERIRKLASFLSIVKMTFYMGIAVYLPALALNAVTPMGLQTTMLLTSGICTFYTALGGMKAVIWTDALQTFIMFSGGLAAMIKIVIMVGGTNAVLESLEKGGRLNMWDFNLDPTLQRTFWTIFIGYNINLSHAMCVRQATGQRYLSCKSINHARMAAIISVFPTMLFTLVAVFSGCAAYAYYETCDPLQSGKITKYDQLMPHLVSEVFHSTPGMTGLFVSAAFSGTLSTVSSGINSLGSLILEDFIVPSKRSLSEASRVAISKTIAVGLGCLVLAMAFLTETMSGTIVSIGTSLDGSASGPLLALFTLGIFFPWTNTIGALVGLVVGMAMAGWISVSAIVYGIPPEMKRLLPISTDNCTNPENQTWLEISSLKNGDWNLTTSTPIQEEQSYTWFPVSFMYHSAIGFALTIIVGLLVSFATGANDPAKSDPKYFLPVVDNPMLPKKIIKFFRFGVPEVKKETHPESDEMIKLCRVKKEEANDSITNSNSTSEDNVKEYA
ncbi:unnamed protein product [Clavelina lepadiformis]|uniref:Sodium-coupled monocarboxylate transporter 1 n=2 Tax=Clavelina lepadiformis TaxID=159417 RepID=A0ABP0GSH9_CLALP